MEIFVLSIPIVEVIYRWNRIDEPELVVVSEWRTAAVTTSWRLGSRHTRLEWMWKLSVDGALQAGHCMAGFLAEEKTTQGQVGGGARRHDSLLARSRTTSWLVAARTAIAVESKRRAADNLSWPDRRLAEVAWDTSAQKQVSLSCCSSDHFGGLDSRRVNRG